MVNDAEPTRTVEKDAGIWTLCPDCPHGRHSRPCTRQVRGMEDVYRDCGCVTSEET